MLSLGWAGSEFDGSIEGPAVWLKPNDSPRKQLLQRRSTQITNFLWSTIKNVESECGKGTLASKEEVSANSSKSLTRKRFHRLLCSLIDNPIRNLVLKLVSSSDPLLMYPISDHTLLATFVVNTVLKHKPNITIWRIDWTEKDRNKRNLSSQPSRVIASIPLRWEN